jgi:sodium/bile acid cotransporter 3/5
VNLSVTLTFISTVASLGMMPLWMYLLSDTLLSGSEVAGTTIRIPYMDIIRSLLCLVIPLLIGVGELLLLFLYFYLFFRISLLETTFG